MTTILYLIVYYGFSGLKRDDLLKENVAFDLDLLVLAPFIVLNPYVDFNMNFPFINLFLLYHNLN